MKLVLSSLTILISLALNSRSATIDVTERDEYLNGIAEDLWNQLIEYDFSNLPIHHYDLAYNTTTWGHELVGRAYYEDGFLMDIESAEVDIRTTSTVITQSGIRLASSIQFLNLNIFFDVRAEFTVGHRISTVVIKPEEYAYDIAIVQDLATMNVTGTLVSGRSTNANFIWDYNPDDPLFARLTRHYITQALGHFIHTTAVSDWNPILQEMLTNAVDRRKFPKLIL